MKKLLVAIAFLLLTPCVVKAQNQSSLKIIEQIEKNLIYSEEIKKKQSGEGISIQHGVWSAEELEDDSVAKTTTTDGTQPAPAKKIQAEILEPEQDERLVSLKRKAYDAMKTEQYEVAIDIYRKILKKNKDDNYSKLSLATAYHKLGQYRQAKPIYLELLDAFPGDERLMSNLLAIVIDETPFEAVYLLSALAEKNPKSALIQAQTSVAYANVKEYDKAIKYIKKTIVLDPSNLQYRYNLAVLHDMNKEYGAAHSMYREIIRYAQNNDAMDQVPYKEIKNRITTLENYI